jgi:hypothetical protein
MRDRLQPARPRRGDPAGPRRMASPYARADRAASLSSAGRESARCSVSCIFDGTWSIAARVEALAEPGGIFWGRSRRSSRDCQRAASWHKPLSGSSSAQPSSRQRWVEVPSRLIEEARGALRKKARERNNMVLDEEYLKEGTTFLNQQEVEFTLTRRGLHFIFRNTRSDLTQLALGKPRFLTITFRKTCVPTGHTD